MYEREEEIRNNKEKRQVNEFCIIEIDGVEYVLQYTTYGQLMSGESWNKLMMWLENQR
jgi:hypothetical protein